MWSFHLYTSCGCVHRPVVDVYMYFFCYIFLSLQSTPPIEEDSWRHRRLRSELKTLRTDPPEGIQATPLDRHCCHWQASITGPHGSPYEGGLFLLYLQIPHRCVASWPWLLYISGGTKASRQGTVANRKHCRLPADNIVIAMGCIIRHSHCVVSKASPPNSRHVIIYLFMKCEVDVGLYHLKINVYFILWSYLM